MNLPEFAIRKPVTVFMLTMIIVLFGVVSLTKLPVELYPNTSFGEISIIIQVRGGIPPTEVENLVTKPIEEAVATVSNLQQLLSISKEGEATIVLSFKPGTDMDFAALEVREKFSKVKNQLRLSRFTEGGDEGEHGSLQAALGRALALAEHTMFDGDPSLVNTEIDRYLTVTPEQLKEAAQKYLRTDNRSVVYIRPAPQAKPAGNAGR